jgi:hypothetical protein
MNNSAAYSMTPQNGTISPTIASLSQASVHNFNKLISSPSEHMNRSTADNNPNLVANY